MRTAVLALVFVSSTLRGADFTGRVVAVDDGDTIDVLRDRRVEKIRLNGIDCPEILQAYGSRAKEYTTLLVFGKDVRVIVQGRDAWGRTLAQVVAPDGTVLNRELVRVGLAWWYYSFAPKDRDLEKLQAEAKAARAGLWAEAHPMAPWFFRDSQAGRGFAPTPRPFSRWH